MYFFKPKQPILQQKKLTLNAEETALMKCFEVKILESFYLCGIYTCIDQAMLIWGLVSGIIFISAQFLAISWIEQAIFWSIITFIGIIAMWWLTHTWTFVEKISNLLYCWGFLMISGVIITDYAIASGWGFMLMHLCDLWLTLSAIGYIVTGFMLRSRAFFLAAFVHLLTIFILPWFMAWQFAITGLVMMSNLIIFSEGQWDMLLPRELNNHHTTKKIRHYSSSSSYSLSYNQIFAQVFKNIILQVFT